MSLFIKKIGAGPALVFLHGWGFTHKVWLPVVDLLAEHYCCWLIDLPGFGESEALPSEAGVEEVMALLLSALPERARVLGWSLGGMLAMKLALDHPQRVSRLLTVSASAKYLLAENWPGVPAGLLASFADAIGQDPKKALTQFLLLQHKGEAQEKRKFLQLRSRVFAEGFPDKSVLLQGLRWLKTLNVRQSLGQLHCPSGHFYGALDAVMPAVDVASAMRGLLPHSFVHVLPQCGHALFLSDALGFSSKVLEFLDGNV